MKLSRTTEWTLAAGFVAVVLVLLVLTPVGVNLPIVYRSACYYNVNTGKVRHERVLFGITVRSTVSDTEWTSFTAGCIDDTNCESDWNLITTDGYSLLGRTLHGDGDGGRVMMAADDLMGLAELREFGPGAKELAVKEFIRVARTAERPREAGSFVHILYDELAYTTEPVTAEDVQRAIDVYITHRTRGTRP